MEEKIIYGQPYIKGDSLVQDQTKITSRGKVIDIPAAVIIEDIWDNLKNNNPYTYNDTSATYKTNNKKDYFYWEVKQTSIESDDIEVTINFECPKPKDGLFDDLWENKIEPDDNSVLSKGDYAAYWYKKIYTSRVNYQNEMTVQKKEVTFEPVTMTDYSKDNFGEVREVLPRYTIKNDDLGDISNLLSLF
jgi:hypothetical protein